MFYINKKIVYSCFLPVIILSAITYGQQIKKITDADRGFYSNDKIYCVRHIPQAFFKKSQKKHAPIIVYDLSTDSLKTVGNAPSRSHLFFHGVDSQENLYFSHHNYSKYGGYTSTGQKYDIDIYRYGMKQNTKELITTLKLKHFYIDKIIRINQNELLFTRGSTIAVKKFFFGTESLHEVHRPELVKYNLVTNAETVLKNHFNGIIRVEQGSPVFYTAINGNFCREANGKKTILGNYNLEANKIANTPLRPEFILGDDGKIYFTFQRGKIFGLDTTKNVYEVYYEYDPSTTLIRLFHADQQSNIYMISYVNRAGSGDLNKIINNPKLLNLNPANNIENFNLKNPISMQFSKPISKTSVDSGGIQLKDVWGRTISVAVKLDSSGTLVKLTPLIPIAPGTYYIYIETKLTDQNGIQYPKREKFVFHTQDER